MACSHVKQVVQYRQGDKYGLNVRVKCSCGKITTGWKTDLWKARICFHQIKEDRGNADHGNAD